MTRTECSKRRRAGAHAFFEDDVNKISERCTKAAYKIHVISEYVRDTRDLSLTLHEVHLESVRYTSTFFKQVGNRSNTYYDECINMASRRLYIYIINSYTIVYFFEE